MKSVSEFDKKILDGLEPRGKSNQYITANRVSADGKKIIVKVADAHLRKSKFGYILILDRNHVVFLKEWQVSKNYFGNEVLLNKDYWIVKEFGDFSDEFFEEKQNLEFEEWLNTAKLQEEHENYVTW